MGLDNAELEAVLKASMRQELLLFLGDVFNSNRPVQELLTATDLFIDGALSQHLGLAWVGRAFVHLDGTRLGRGGLLRMTGILTVLSHPKRTSPVRRGKWIYEALLCGFVPPPPDEMEFPEIVNHLSLTAKEALEYHLDMPECAACHQLMDPLGFALEKFDEHGVPRALDEGIPIDPEGALPDGTIVNGSQGLAETLAEDPQFLDCVVHRFLTYALGREPMDHEATQIDDLRAQWEALGYGVKDLVSVIARHSLLRTRVPTIEESVEEGR
jgi:hypothetical protein